LEKYAKPDWSGFKNLKEFQDKILYWDAIKELDDQI